MESKARVTSIKATSRMSIKVRDNFCTIEYCEERALPEGLTEQDIANERVMLWNTVNNECDTQIETIIESYNS